MAPQPSLHSALLFVSPLVLTPFVDLFQHLSCYHLSGCRCLTFSLAPSGLAGSSLLVRGILPLYLHFLLLPLALPSLVFVRDLVEPGLYLPDLEGDVHR